MDTLDLTTLMVVTVAAGIGAQVFGKYLKVPGIVFLLLFGIALGANGLAIVRPEVLGAGLGSLVSLSVALILFEGGLTLNLNSISQISDSLRNLVTIGPLITLVGGGIAAHVLAGFPWNLAFLYASLVVVTGPTAIGPLLKQVPVERPVATLLEGESVLIDPIGAILALLVLNAISTEEPDPARLVTNLGLRLGIGIAIGAAGGGLLGWFLKQANFLEENLKNLVVLASVWSLYAVAQYVRDESGLMAVVVAGIVLSAASVPELRVLRRFKSQLTVLAVSVLFVLLAADLSLKSLIALGWGGVLTVVVLMLVVRPLMVWLCIWDNTFTWRQKLFISWIAPRGIVSASVASLFAMVLGDRGMTGGESVKSLVFLTIIITVLAQGLTAQIVANLLKVTAQETTGAVIVGANPLARLVARLFQERQEPAVLIDRTAESCAGICQEQPDSLRVFLNGAADTKVLEQAGVESVGTFLAMTRNGEVNVLLAQRAAEEFEPPRVLAVFHKESEEGSAAAKVQQAMTSDLPLEIWNQHLTQGNARLVEVALGESGFVFQQTYLQALIDAGQVVPLLIQRQERLQVVSAGQPWQPGDRLICLAHDPNARLIDRFSRIDPIRLALEQLPSARELPLPDGDEEVPMRV